MSKLCKLFALPPAEWGYLALAWVLLGMVELALRYVSLSTLMERLQIGRGRLSFDAPRTACFSERLAQLTGIAGRHVPFDATCLKQALVLSYLLALHRIESRLHIGVLRENGLDGTPELQAHAWIEQGGLVILGQELQARYHLLYTAGFMMQH